MNETAIEEIHARRQQIPDHAVCESIRQSKPKRESKKLQDFRNLL